MVAGLTKSRLHNRTMTAQSRRPRSPTARTSYLSNYDRTADDARFSLAVYIL